MLSHALPDDFVISAHLQEMRDTVSTIRSQAVDVTQRAEKQLKFEARLKHSIETLPSPQVSSEVLGNADEFMKTRQAD